MKLAELCDLLPDYAKDIKLNVSNILKTNGFSPQALWGTIYASSLVSKSPILVKVIEEDIKDILEPESINAVKAAAAIMGMNNIYYRFLHLVENNEYKDMPANLRMSIINNHGVEKLDFELWALAVSAIHGCGMCIDAHEKSILKHGGKSTYVQNTIRIASIIHALAIVVTTENLSL